MGIEIASSRNPEQLEEASTRELLQEVLGEAKELARLEVQLARADATEELAALKRAAVGFAIALAATVLVLCLLAMALVLALGGTPLVALLVAAGFTVVGGVAALIGYGMLPKVPFERTRIRLQTDVNQLKEHIA